LLVLAVLTLCLGGPHRNWRAFGVYYLKEEGQCVFDLIDLLIDNASG